ncbi:hypothetical protein D6D04_06235 [Aureobasidium pullulans]|nr:hypothetical protein D6D04_06235 [Aureobasidium pullulans]
MSGSERARQTDSKPYFRQVSTSQLPFNTNTPEGLLPRVDQTADQPQAFSLLLNAGLVINTLRNGPSAQSDVVKAQIELLREYEAHYMAEVNRHVITAMTLTMATASASASASAPVASSSADLADRTRQDGGSHSDNQTPQVVFPCPDHRKPSYSHNQGDCLNPWQSKPKKQSSGPVAQQQQPQQQQQQPLRRDNRRNENAQMAAIQAAEKITRKGGLVVWVPESHVDHSGRVSKPKGKPKAKPNKNQGPHGGKDGGNPKEQGGGSKDDSKSSSTKGMEDTRMG